MAIDALRSYLQLASGLTEVTKERAKAAAQALISSNPVEGGTSAVTALGSTVTANAGALADDLVAASKANRKLLVGLIRSEVDRAVHRLGLATGDELDALAERVARIEGRPGIGSSATRASATPTVAAKKPAKKTAAKKAAVQKAAAKKSAVRGAAGNTVAEKSAVAAPSAATSDEAQSQPAPSAVTAARSAPAGSAPTDSGVPAESRGGGESSDASSWQASTPAAGPTRAEEQGQ
jgi:hypothetical protein